MYVGINVYTLELYSKAVFATIYVNGSREILENPINIMQ